ncbi:DHS-like NAD/FAD-binding domain-containing protein [Acrodontium crateriforme]|uniref:DHS-like NAD/FAD-binding domain-containing protein n=1 Tax=Acrodontium crateriforme TaxID=150365 RepID=A0AAQ3LYL3_9PEZI|nr:DHS-like NAD/FAD-binding domain-containing protein [Acrodontium crateriforme]
MRLRRYHDHVKLIYKTLVARNTKTQLHTRTMTSAATINEQDVASFHKHLRGSTHILALLGAGLSAPSGLPTFRGAGGLWRTHDAVSLASPEAFEADPGLVWQFYNYRRHMALNVNPNPAHYALAELAKRMPGFATLSQNVDGLSPRAGHPPEQLHLLHGSLFQIKCASERCDYVETNFDDPFCEALRPPEGIIDPTANSVRGTAPDISDASVSLPSVPRSALPSCPSCKSDVLRPGVVWFGEPLPEDVLGAVDDYINSAEKIDLIMVIGTSSKVQPAAGYVGPARRKGARVCVINMDPNDGPSGGWRKGDWMFTGDAAVLVPKLLEPVIGSLPGQED